VLSTFKVNGDKMKFPNRIFTFKNYYVEFEDFGYTFCALYNIDRINYLNDYFIRGDTGKFLDILKERLENDEFDNFLIEIEEYNLLII
jgi:hypothetical protein